MRSQTNPLLKFLIGHDGLGRHMTTYVAPVARLLADHNTGSGKTLVIIRVLDDFYFDKRAKIAVFPKDVVVDNFYLGLVEWPSRGRDYLCVQNRSLARLASQRDDWKSARHLRWRISMLNKRIAQKVEAIPGTTSQKVLKEELVVPTRATPEMKRAFFSGEIHRSLLTSYWNTGDDDACTDNL